MIRKLAVVVMALALLLTGCSKEAKVEALKKEGDKLAVSGKYLEAAEKYKEASALLTGEKYVADPAPKLTQEKRFESNWKKLSITDTMVTKDSINASLTGKITNNGNVKLGGYFEVYFLDAGGNVVRDYTGRLPAGGLAPGQTSRFSILINQFPYASYEFDGSAIGEEN